VISTKTPLMALVRTAYRLAKTAHQSTGIPADEILDEWAEHQSRRAFLRKSGQLALLAGGVSTLNACVPANFEPGPPSIESLARTATQPCIAIIGAGIAGLHAAHILSNAGQTNFTIYEGANRTGGRILTARNIMATGLTTELGGEFIDSGHRDVIRLAEEFGLTLLDTQAPSETALIKDAYFFNGRHYSLTQVVDAFREITPQMERDINSLPNTITYQNNNAAARRLDQLSISAYLDQIGARGLIKDLLEVAYETEYGLDPDQQSVINMLFLISTDTKKGRFDIFGISDERYKIQGGNGQLTNRLADRYASHIETGRVLQAIRPVGSRYELAFEGSSSIRADYVLVTIPFTKLREVDINVPLETVKRRSINQLGYGTNAKLFLGFSERRWRSLGYSGYIFSNNGAQSGWDNSQLQPGMAGGYTVYLGGLRGENLGNGSVASQASSYLPRLNEIFPGSQARFNGRAERFHWPSYRFTKGSYACYTVGQWTNIGGAEGEPVGRLFFAGEHCSADFQGYMNGGAETGRKAARALLKILTASNAG